jgi:hypothetical protein
LGRPKTYEVADWIDYPTTYGLTSAHIPELLRLLQDPLYLDADYDDKPEGYAFVHAMRALGQLRDPSVIPDLIQWITTEDNNDWLLDELPVIFGLIGPTAIPALTAAIRQHRDNSFIAMSYTSSLEKIALTHPDAKADCIRVYTELLQAAEQNDPTLNGAIISDLINLDAKETLPVIEQAFAKDQVDIFFVGDWDDVQVHFGLKAPDPNKKRNPPPQLAAIAKLFEHFKAGTIPDLDDISYEIPDRFKPLIDMSQDMPHLNTSQNVPTNQGLRAEKAKKKAKNKQAKKSRKQNRKK